MEKLTIYILKEDRNDWFIDYVAFTEKDARFYIQYRKKGEDKYTSKHWFLEELVWEYERYDDKMTISLITKVIEI